MSDTRHASLERIRTQEPHLLHVEASLHPAQHDVVDPLLVAQLEKRLAPPADESDGEARVLVVVLDDGIAFCTAAASSLRCLSSS